MPTRQAPVWARGDVFTARCPKSLITSQSMRWLDEFDAWKTLGNGDPHRLDTKSAEAIALLDLEYRRELTREEEQK